MQCSGGTSQSYLANRSRANSVRSWPAQRAALFKVDRQVSELGAAAGRDMT